VEDMTSRSNGDDDGDQQTESTTVHDHTADATNDNSSSETAAQNSVSCAAVHSWGQQKS